MMGLRWASMFCPEAKFVVRVDDDVFLNLNNLIKFLRSHQNLQVGGLVYEGHSLTVLR